MGAASHAPALGKVMQESQGYHPFVTQIAKLVQARTAEGVPLEEARAEGNHLLQQWVASQPPGSLANETSLMDPGFDAPQDSPPQGELQQAPGATLGPSPQEPASLGELAGTARGGLASFLASPELGGRTGRAALGTSPQVTPAPTASPRAPQAPRLPGGPQASTFEMTPRSTNLQSFTDKDLQALGALQPLLALSSKSDIEKMKLEAKARDAEATRQLKASTVNARIKASFMINAAKLDDADRKHATDIMLALEKIRQDAENVRVRAATTLQASAARSGASAEVEAKKEAGRNARTQLIAELATKRATLTASLGALRSMLITNPALMSMDSFGEQVEAAEAAVRAMSDAAASLEVEPKTEFPAPIGGVDVFGQGAPAPAAPGAPPPKAPGAKTKAPGKLKAPPGNPPDPTKFREAGPADNRRWMQKTAAGTWAPWKG